MNFSGRGDLYPALPEKFITPEFVSEASSKKIAKSSFTKGSKV